MYFKCVYVKIHDLPVLGIKHKKSYHMLITITGFFSIYFAENTK